MFVDALWLCNMCVSRWHDFIVCITTYMCMGKGERSGGRACLHLCVCVCVCVCVSRLGMYACMHVRVYVYTSRVWLWVSVQAWFIVFTHAHSMLHSGICPDYVQGWHYPVFSGILPAKICIYKLYLYQNKQTKSQQFVRPSSCCWLVLKTTTTTKYYTMKERVCLVCACVCVCVSETERERETLRVCHAECTAVSLFWP